MVLIAIPGVERRPPAGDEPRLSRRRAELRRSSHPRTSYLPLRMANLSPMPLRIRIRPDRSNDRRPGPPPVPT